MPLSMQVKVRTLQDNVVRTRENQQQHVDLRVVSASKNLDLLNHPDFAKTFFYRFDVAQLHITSLSERGRRSLIFEHFISRQWNRVASEIRSLCLVVVCMARQCRELRKYCDSFQLWMKAWQWAISGVRRPRFCHRVRNRRHPLAVQSAGFERKVIHDALIALSRHQWCDARFGFTRQTLDKIVVIIHVEPKTIMSIRKWWWDWGCLNQWAKNGSSYIYHFINIDHANVPTQCDSYL